MPRPRLGPLPMTAAERQARHRAKQRPCQDTHTPAPRLPPRPQRWTAAVATLVALQDEYRAWLMRITANCAIDFLRRRGNRSLPFDECEHVPGTLHQAGASGWGESPEISFTRLEQLSILADAIAKLPPELRNVCLLRNMMELSTKEVAARLGIPAITVRVRLFRAHGQLRKILDRRNAWRRTQRTGSEPN